MERHPQFLNMGSPNGNTRENNNKRSHEAAYNSQNKILELKLGPPGDHHNNNYKNITASGARNVFDHTTIEAETKDRNWLTNNEEFQGPEKKACSTPTNYRVNIVEPSSSHKRINALPQRPVVGWPPVRSCRKNISTSNSTKIESESRKDGAGVKSENLDNSLFVKIKMDGVPIGRKVDLKSYSDYDKLSSAVDQLFRGFLAVQGDCSHSSNEHTEKTKAITGLLDGTGDYTLVYEDNEGDRMLVGDVPWHMFISSAKRLRVLKKSEVSDLSIFSNKDCRGTS